MSLLVFPASAMLGPSPSLYMATTATLYSVSGSSCCSWAVVVVPGTKTYMETKNKSEMDTFEEIQCSMCRLWSWTNHLKLAKKREGQTDIKPISIQHKQKQRPFPSPANTSHCAISDRKHQITTWWVSLIQSGSEDSWLHRAFSFPLALSVSGWVQTKGGQHPLKDLEWMDLILEWMNVQF